MTICPFYPCQSDSQESVDIVTANSYQEQLCQGEASDELLSRSFLPPPPSYPPQSAYSDLFPASRANFMDSVWSEFYQMSFREMVSLKNIPDEVRQAPAVTRMESEAV